MGIALEAGAEDFRADPEGYEILTDPAHFESVHKQIEGKGIKCAQAHLTFLPTLTVPVAGTDAAAVTRLIEAIEDHDDIQKVYANFDVSKETMDKLKAE